MPMDFRTIRGRPAALGIEARLAISYAYTIEQNILELVEAGAAPAAPVLPIIALNLDAAMAGERERLRLGVTSGAQMGWQFAEAFRNWRTIIEGAGVFVLQQKFDLEDCRGFTIFRNANAPLAMVNKREEYEPAKIFTLIHEYAHILLRQPGLSDFDESNQVEALCNRFAGGFLMPRALLAELLPYWPNQPVEWDFDLIAGWARRAKVSQQALALRLEQVGVPPAGYYQRLIAQQHRAPKREGEGGNYVSTQVSELGYRFASVVLGAAHNNKIERTEAAEILALSPRHFDLVRERLDQQFVNLGAGAGAIFN